MLIIQTPYSTMAVVGMSMIAIIGVGLETGLDDLPVTPLDVPAPITTYTAINTVAAGNPLTIPPGVSWRTR
jgi:hypothetical protein